MNSVRKNRGPWTHRFLICFLSFLLGLLTFWLLGFIVDDIGRLRGPAIRDVEEGVLQQELVMQDKALSAKLAEIGRRVKALEARQSLLRDSTNTSQQTLRQMLDMQRLSLQKGVELSEAQRQALSDSQALFLSNQKLDQTLNEQIVGLRAEEETLRDQKADITEKLAVQRQEAMRLFGDLRSKHNLKVATLKLCVLVPLLIVAFVVFLKKRGTTYAPLVYATGAAIVLKVGLVMHDYFPKEYFKYVLILVCLGIVLKILAALLRMVARPKMDWLLKQYREAYERFLCPMCGYPIRRGPRKYMFWTGRTIKKQPLPPSAAADVDEAYTCPACGAKLFEECESCHAVRHSVLPFCEKCGSQKDLHA